MRIRKTLVSLTMLLSLHLGCKREGIIPKAPQEAKENQQSTTIKKKTDNRRSLLNRFFDGGFEQDKPIAVSLSASGSSSRYLMSLKKSEKLYKYILFEVANDGGIRNYGYVISDNSLKGKNMDLYEFVLKKDTVLYYDRLVKPKSRKEQEADYKEGLRATTTVSRQVIINGVNSTKSVKTNSLVSVNVAELPCEPTEQVCIDWYWVTYDPETGEVYAETYLYSTCGCPGGGGGGGDGGPGEYKGPGYSNMYICAGSFSFIPQTPGSNTNIAKTWGIKAGYITSSTVYEITFGIVTYAPKDVVNWYTAWQDLKSYFPELIDDHHITLQPDAQQNIHMQYDTYAQSKLAAAASDHASDNYLNPKSVLTQVGGSITYKNKFESLYEGFMKQFIPGTTTGLIHSPTSGTTSAVYGSSPC